MQTYVTRIDVSKPENDSIPDDMCTVNYIDNSSYSIQKELLFQFLWKCV